MKRLGSAGLWTAVLLVAAVVLLVLLPLGTMVHTVWTEPDTSLGAVLSEPTLRTALRNSLLLSLAVTVMAVPIGAGAAIQLRRSNLPWRGLLQVGMMLPLLVPDFVLAYSWLRAYGRSGFSDDLFGVAWPGLEGPVGTAVVVGVNAVPLAYLVIAVGLAARAEPAGEQAARLSGARPLTVLRTITLPLLWPALLSAALLVFVMALGSFAVPRVLGSPAGFTTVTTQIYADLARSSESAAFVEALVLALLLVLIASATAGPSDLLLRPRLRRSRDAVIDPAPAGRTGSGGPRWATGVMLTYLTLTVGVPLVALVSTSLTKAVGLSPSPANWTTKNFESAFTVRNAEALGRSLLLALLAASALLVLGGCAAALERKRLGRGAGTLMMLTFVLPGSTLAAGLLITYGRWLSGTLLLILLAYLAKLGAFAHRPIAGALERLPPDELAAARVSGASVLVGIRAVVLRPLAPALVVAWFVVFVTALHEVTMSSLLYGPGDETFAVVVLNSEELGQVGLTAALAVLITALVLFLAAVCWVAVRRLTLAHVVQPATRGGFDG